MAQFDVKKIAFPFKRGASGRNLMFREQDSDEEIMDKVEVLLRTILGTRIEIPEYGLAEQTFSEGGAKREEILAAIEIWEPRALAVIENDPVAITDLVDRVKVAIDGRTDA